MRGSQPHAPPPRARGVLPGPDRGRCPDWSARWGRACFGSWAPATQVVTLSTTLRPRAGVAELADAPGLGPGELRLLEVRLLSPALRAHLELYGRTVSTSSRVARSL